MARHAEWLAKVERAASRWTPFARNYRAERAQAGDDGGAAGSGGVCVGRPGCGRSLALVDAT